MSDKAIESKEPNNDDKEPENELKCFCCWGLIKGNEPRVFGKTKVSVGVGIDVFVSVVICGACYQSAGSPLPSLPLPPNYYLEYVVCPKCGVAYPKCSSHWCSNTLPNYTITWSSNTAGAIPTGTIYAK